MGAGVAAWIAEASRSPGGTCLAAFSDARRPHRLHAAKAVGTIAVALAFGRRIAACLVALLATRSEKHAAVDGVANEIVIHIDARGGAVHRDLRLVVSEEIWRWLGGSDDPRKRSPWPICAA